MFRGTSLPCEQEISTGKYFVTFCNGISLGSMSGMGPTSSMPPGGGRGPSAPPMGYPGMMRPQMMPQGGRY